MPVDRRASDREPRSLGGWKAAALTIDGVGSYNAADSTASTWTFTFEDGVASLHTVVDSLSTPGANATDLALRLTFPTS